MVALAAAHGSDLSLISLNIFTCNMQPSKELAGSHLFLETRVDLTGQMSKPLY